MKSITQYRPGFVDSDEPLQTVEFQTLDELCAVPFVKRFISDKFTGFHVTSSGMLMANYSDQEFPMAVGKLAGEQFDPPDVIV